MTTDDAEIIRLRRLGLTLDKIAVATRISKRDVHKLLKAHGLSHTRGQNLSDAEIATAKNLRREGKTAREIAAIIGRPRSTVSNVFYQPSRFRPAREPKVTPMTIPPEVLADRERRLATPPRDLTALIFNDPIPGWSHWDRTHARHA